MPTLYIMFLLIGWGIAAPLGAHFITQWKTQVEEQAQCAIRVADEGRRIASEVNAAAEKRIAEAADAAANVTPTPSAPEELLALCNKDPNCRERRAP